MLAKIATLRSTDRPKFLPTIRFDEILIRHIHPDRIESIKSALIAEYRPKHNLELLRTTPTFIIERRI
jgi:hypothetical protein